MTKDWTNAPFLIYAWPSRVPEDKADWTCGDWDANKRYGSTSSIEYVRSDLYDQLLNSSGATLSRAETAEDTIEVLRHTLLSIACNTCCERCSEAAAVARKALE